MKAVVWEFTRSAKGYRFRKRFMSRVQVRDERFEWIFSKNCWACQKLYPVYLRGNIEGSFDCSYGNLGGGVLEKVYARIRLERQAEWLRWL